MMKDYGGKKQLMEVTFILLCHRMLTEDSFDKESGKLR